MMFVRITLSLLITLVVTSLHGQERPAQWATPVSTTSLHNLYKIDEGVYRMEQPTAAQMIELERMGIKEVLNLRNYHNNQDEGRGTGLLLRHVRMNAHDIELAKVAEALRIIKHREGNIAFHCKHGSDRTGTVAALYRMVFQGWSKEAALDELRNGGYGYHSIFMNIPRFVEQVDVAELRRMIDNP